MNEPEPLSSQTNPSAAQPNEPERSESERTGGMRVDELQAARQPSGGEHERTQRMEVERSLSGAASERTRVQPNPRHAQVDRSPSGAKSNGYGCLAVLAVNAFSGTRSSRMRAALRSWSSAPALVPEPASQVMAGRVEQAAGGGQRGGG
jgi:hypothetical protein